jgi:hypothetical protein
MFSDVNKPRRLSTVFCAGGVQAGCDCLLISGGGAVMLYVTLYIVALGLCGFGFCAGLLMIANMVD